MDDFLLAEKALTATVSAPDDGVDVLLTRANGKLLLLAVNLLDRPVTAQIASPGLRGVQTLTGYREETTAGVSRGKLTLSFAPYGVHLLTDPPLPRDGKSLDTIKEEIAAAKAALAKPGNLLYGRGREDRVGCLRSLHLPAFPLHAVRRDLRQPGVEGCDGQKRAGLVCP